jgi:hypothetical protein
MSRPKIQPPLATKLAQAFMTVGKMQRRGINTERGYSYLYASDLFDALRTELFKRNVLILPDESTPEYVSVAMSNSGEQITECRLPVAYTFIDDQGTIGPYRVNGIARTADEKCLYIAQIGSRKALLKAVGLIAQEDEDPEFSERYVTDGAHVDHAQAMREAEASKRTEPKTVTRKQMAAFGDACRNTGKAPDEISGYLLTAHQVSTLADLGRGRPFTQALVWAAKGAEALAIVAPKSQPAPAMQSKLPLPAPPLEMRIGQKTVTVEPKTGSYAL